MEEFCVKCTNTVDQLDEYTGWCLPCSGIATPTDTPTYYTRWIEINADPLEELMSTGLSLRASIRKLRSDYRPRCLICGSSIRGGARGRANFCGKTQQCKSAQRRYRTLKEGAAHLSPSIALEQIMREQN